MDTPTPDQIKAGCLALNATPDQRRAALESIAERRALLAAELAQLDAMAEGHKEALGRKP